MPVEEAVYVGDRLRTDAMGAATAGLTGIWLARAGASAVGVADTDDAARLGVLRIDTLASLPGLFAALPGA